MINIKKSFLNYITIALSSTYNVSIFIPSANHYNTGIRWFPCSTMWVGCQSRWFLCLFWRETKQRILGPEISPYPEVVRGREWELTTRSGREAVDGGPGRAVGDWTAGRLDTGEFRGWQTNGKRKKENAIRTRNLQNREELAAGQQRVGVEERTGAVNTGHRSREARQHGIGSSESESRWVWFQ